MVADQLQEEKIWRGKLGRSSAAGSSSAPIANKRMPLKPPNPAQSTATGIDATSRKIFEHLPLVIGGGGGGGRRRRTLRVGCGSVLLPSPPKYKGRIEMKKADWDTKKSRNVRVPITREMLRPKLEFLSLCVCVCEVLNDVDDPVNRSSCSEERVLSLAVVEVARKKGQRWRVKRAHSEIG